MHMHIRTYTCTHKNTHPETLTHRHSPTDAKSHIYFKGMHFPRIHTQSQFPNKTKLLKKRRKRYDSSARIWQVSRRCSSSLMSCLPSESASLYGSNSKYFFVIISKTLRLSRWLQLPHHCYHCHYHQHRPHHCRRFYRYQCHPQPSPPTTICFIISYLLLYLDYKCYKCIAIYCRISFFRFSLFVCVNSCSISVCIYMCVCVCLS